MSDVHEKVIELKKSYGAPRPTRVHFTPHDELNLLSDRGVLALTAGETPAFACGARKALEANGNTFLGLEIAEWTAAETHLS